MGTRGYGYVDDQEAELPDPPDGCPIWLDLLSQSQRDQYAGRIERGLARNQAALYDIERRRLARDKARAIEDRERASGLERERARRRERAVVHGKGFNRPRAERGRA